MTVVVFILLLLVFNKTYSFSIVNYIDKSLYQDVHPLLKYEIHENKLNLLREGKLKVSNKVKYDSEQFLITLNEIKDFNQSVTWIILIRSDRGFNGTDIIKESLHEDGNCLLYSSTISNYYIKLKIGCPPTLKTKYKIIKTFRSRYKRDLADILKTPLLKNTMGILIPIFGKDSIIIEKNYQYKNPSFQKETFYRKSIRGRVEEDWYLDSNYIRNVLKNNDFFKENFYEDKKIYNKSFLSQLFYYNSPLKIFKNNAYHDIRRNSFINYLFKRNNITNKSDIEILDKYINDKDFTLICSIVDSNEEPIKKLTTVIQHDSPWGLDRINQHSGFLDSDYSYTNTAHDIIAIIIDTGILSTHFEFTGRAQFLVNTVGDDIDTDCNGHGTHVAGIIGSETYGVAKNILLKAVKVLDCNGEGSLSTISDGINYIISNINLITNGNPSLHKIVINLSLGGPASIELDNMIQHLIDNDMSVIVAAGNDNQNSCNYSPARLSHAITVAASNDNDHRAYFSNYGECVDLSAPGTSIISTWIGSSNEETQILSGTSMATPFVTGVVGLTRQQDKSLSCLEANNIVLQWVTPDIILGSSVSGGGKNLLFSLVDTSSLPPPSIVPPPSHFSPGGVSRNGITIVLFIIVFIINSN